MLTEEGFSIVVNYSKALAEMIEAGHYDLANNNITQDHFPIQGKGRVKRKIKLVSYANYMASADVIRDLKKRGLRPATLPELLAFGSAYPDKQRYHPIVALGSIWRDPHRTRFMAYLFTSGCQFVKNRRELELGTWRNLWRGDCHFAAVRN